jgi:hypothetical protein
MKKILYSLIIVISMAFAVDAVQLIQPTPENLPDKTGHEGEFLKVSVGEAAIEWAEVDLSSVRTDLIEYTASSVTATNTLNVVPASYTPITLTATGTLKFTADFACKSATDFASFKLEGLLVRGSTIRFVGATIKTKWEITSGTFDIIASHSSDGILKFIASGPTNLEVFGNVLATKIGG